ncbi:hypothetical protein BDY21DRAFT_338031 [Lineolata rhizophorae]|uniref:Uncharacterized protein n=1 Tax=Lineolata rhizophorae TaxID=578093 RepID=A0A6A6P5S9_9PEZI|nr:hypothetical protein BDY21DRAFT_338031 [Lineolata rhizophorae]
MPSGCHARHPYTSLLIRPVTATALPNHLALTTAVIHRRSNYHVPDVFEARRRLAKRRMGAISSASGRYAVGPSPSAPSPGLLAVMFGPSVKKPDEAKVYMPPEVKFEVGPPPPAWPGLLLPLENENRKGMKELENLWEDEKTTDAVVTTTAVGQAETRPATDLPANDVQRSTTKQKRKNTVAGEETTKEAYSNEWAPNPVDWTLDGERYGPLKPLIMLRRSQKHHRVSQRQAHEWLLKVVPSHWSYTQLLSKGQAPIPRAIELLSRPALQHCEVENHFALMKHCISSGINNGEFNQLLRALGRTVKSGALAPDQLSEALMELAHLARRTYPDEGPQRAALTKVYTTMLDHVEVSSAPATRLSAAILMKHLACGAHLGKGNPEGGRLIRRLRAYAELLSEDSRQAHTSKPWDLWYFWARNMPLRRSVPGSYDSELTLDATTLTESINQMPRVLALDWMRKATKEIFSKPKLTYGRLQDADKSALKDWFCCVRQSIHFQSLEPRRGIQELVWNIPSHISPADVALGSLHRDQKLAFREMLITWAIREASKAHGGYSELNAIALRNITKIRWLLRHTARQHRIDHDDPYLRHYLIVIRALCRLELPKPAYYSLSKRFLELLFELRGPQVLAPALVLFKRCRIPYPESLLTHAIQRLVYTDPHQAHRLFLLAGSLPLSRVPSLPLELIRAGPHSAQDAIRLFQRADPVLDVPYLDRNASAPAPEQLSHEPRAVKRRARDTALWQRRARYMRMALRLLAEQPDASSRAAMRNVWRLVREAHMTGTWVGHHGSRALLYAGLLRRLGEGKRVSTERVRWVLDRVRRYEGEEVAVELDKRLCEWRREVVEADRRRWDGAWAERREKRETEMWEVVKKAEEVDGRET